MYSLETDGRLQVTSAISLLEFSRLVHWDDNSAQFIPAQQWEFELSWNESVWPVFGRLICWISFSAGAEFLAKGFCLLNEIDVRQPHSVPANPTGELKVWVARYFDNPDASTQQTTNFGDLNALVSLKDKNNKGKFLRQLCKKKAASPKDENSFWSPTIFSDGLSETGTRMLIDPMCVTTIFTSFQSFSLKALTSS